MPQKTRKQSQERVKRESKAQHERAPMLAVRVPRSLYRALKAAAKDDKRTLADWMRLTLQNLMANRHMPEYRFDLEQGAQAIERSASASGMLATDVTGAKP